MATENYQPPSLSVDAYSKIKDIEERQRLLRERTILIGQSLIEEKEKNAKEFQEIKRELYILKEETIKMREFLQRISEQLEKTARKEDLMILQRQFDLFRKI